MKLNKPKYSLFKNGMYAVEGFTDMIKNESSFKLQILGLFSLAILYSNSLIKVFKERVNVMVEIKTDVQQSEIDAFNAFLKEEESIKTSTVKFISKEKAAEFLREDFGDDFVKLGMPNPFYDVFSFNIKANFLDSEKLRSLKKKILKHKCVGDVFYQENLVEDISKNFKKISYLILGIGIFFLLVAITLIHNTIRLALYSNRFLIKNMQLVGASPEFIGKPYLVRGFLHGMLSGIFSVIILGLVVLLSWKNLPELKSLVNFQGLSFVFLSTIILGILLYLISTYVVLRKFLKLRTEELY